MHPIRLAVILLLGSCTATEGAFQGECSDGQDNDGDGLTDCEDPDCDGLDGCVYEVEDTGLETDADTDADSDTDTDSDSDADGDSDSDADADGDSDSDADADADSDSDADADADTDADVDYDSITDIQQGSYKEDAAVLINGVVPHDETVDGFYVLDPMGGAYSGIWVQNYTKTSFSVLSGDEVEVSGTYVEYYDLSEVALDAKGSVSVLSNGNALPAATVLGTADFTSDKIMEPYEGTLVKIESVTVSEPDLGYGEFEVDGTALVDDQLYDWTAAYILGGGDTFTSITGLLNYSYSAWKLEPTSAADYIGYTELPCPADLCVEDLVAGDLVITEIMKNPSAVSDTDGEFFEVYNSSGGSVCLDGLQIWDDGSDSTTVSSTLVIPADSYVVFGLSDDSSLNGGVTVDVVYSSVSMANGDDEIGLGDLSSPIDYVAYTDADFPDTAGTSMALDPSAIDAASNDDPANWCDSTSVFGSGDYGTPGSENPSCIVSVDADGDGYSDIASGGADCDDGDSSVHPGATEVCDGADNDCDGSADIGAVDATVWYGDGDGDGFGQASITQAACTAPSGYVSSSTDCDDRDAAVHPGATEICDGVDNDCDGSIDGSSASDANTWYRDADVDGYGNSAVSVLDCAEPSGFAGTDGDCDDRDPSINPGATEVCDGTDNDCDGATDIGAVDALVWYRDGDGDGYGDSTLTDVACTQPTGFVASDGDCDDRDPSINPGAGEVYGDGIDQDCDGSDATCSGTVGVDSVSPGSLLITEFHANPAVVSDSDGEWFEVNNLNICDIDVDGLVISDLGSDTFTVSGTVVIGAGDYLVFGSNGDPATNDGVTIDYEYSGFYLSNSSDELVLSNASHELDAVAWDSTWGVSSGYSMQLDPSQWDSASNDDPAAWCLATIAYGTSNAGSPGDDNEVCH